MEIVVVVLLGVFVWIVSSGLRDKPNERRQDESQMPRREAPSAPQPDSVTQPKPFDPNSAHPVPGKRYLEGKAYVVDGDTIKIKGTQIRLFGIDAPEIDHPYGRIAKSALVKLCGGKLVCAEVIEEDDYGRTVARCRLQDRRDLSAEMVKKGLAIDWKKYSGGTYRSIEQPGVRKKKLFLADQRQKGNLKAWRDYEAWREAQAAKN